MRKYGTNSDSEDDYIDEAEEFEGTSRDRKMSIKALNLNKMIVGKETMSQIMPAPHR